MATSIQAPQRKRIPAASPSDSISNTANSTQVKRVLQPTVRSASSETNTVSSSDQNRRLPNHLKPTKRSPPHESFRYVKKDGQNERNSATQGTPRTARRTSPSPGAKTVASPLAKPHHERVTKASKPRKILQLYVKKTTLLTNGTEISKDHADNPKTKQEETFVREIKKVVPVEEEVTMGTEPVAETENVLVDASVGEGNREEERKKLQISDISTGSEEEEKQRPSGDEPSERLAEKEDEEERMEKEKKGGEELEETENEKVRVVESAEEEDGKSTEKGKGEEEGGEGFGWGSRDCHQL